MRTVQPLRSAVIQVQAGEFAYRSITYASGGETARASAFIHILSLKAQMRHFEKYGDRFSADIGGIFFNIVVSNSKKGRQNFTRGNFAPLHASRGIDRRPVRAIRENLNQNYFKL